MGHLAAQRLYQQALELDPSCSVALHKLGEIAYQVLGTSTPYTTEHHMLRPGTTVESGQTEIPLLAWHSHDSTEHSKPLQHGP
jgi:hypothetical protein